MLCFISVSFPLFQSKGLEFSTCFLACFVVLSVSGMGLVVLMVLCLHVGH